MAYVVIETECHEDMNKSVLHRRLTLLSYMYEKDVQKEWINFSRSHGVLVVEIEPLFWIPFQIFGYIIELPDVFIW